MPSQDTWTSISGGRESSYNGRQRTWVNTPGYGGLPKDSKPVNRYDDLIRKYSQSEYSAYHVNNQTGVKTYAFPQSYIWTGDTLDGLIGSFLAQSDASAKVAACENKSMSQALVSASDAKINLSVALAEASKTSDLILSTANRVDRAIRALRRRNFREVARILNLPSNRVHRTWLEYKYGWMPLLMDVKGAAEFFAQQHVGRPARFVVHGRATSEHSFNYDLEFTPYGGLPTAMLRRRLNFSVEAHTKMWLELTHPNYSAMQQLGLTNPALVAWELVPYSFVFDWFYSVGDWLQGMTALQGVSIRRKMMTSFIASNFSQTGPSTTRSDSNYTYYETPYTVSLYRKQFGRGSPVVDPFALPIPKNTGLNFNRLVTSLALLRANNRSSLRV